MSSPQSYTHPPSHPISHIPTISLTPSTKSFLLPTLILILIVIASAIQTEFAHNLTTNLKYDKPYFTFYLTHSSFSLLFPIHLIILTYTTGIPIKVYLQSIKEILINQLGISKDSNWKEIIPIWNKKIIYLTVILSIPAVSWFISMTLSNPVDITSIYSTSAFATYGFSLWLLNTPLSRLTISSIIIAFIGVIVISIDGIKDGKNEEMWGRVVGDLTMLFGAIILGLYEVIYKLALPEDHGGITSSHSNGYSPLPTHHTTSSEPIFEEESLSTFSSIQSIHHRPNFPNQGTDSTPTPIELTPPLSRTTSNAILIHNSHHNEIIKLPPALHANFITSCIGLATLLLLWPPVILLNWMGFENFSWPSGGNMGSIWKSLGMVFLGGTVYNAGLMVLIGLWGPTTSSVANLLTIGLVALIDSIWLGQIPDSQTLLGVGMICIGFGALLWEGEG